MLKDLSERQKDKELVLTAIKALQKKGWDVNAYTVADEAQMTRSTLYRNSELMQLIAQHKCDVSSTSGNEEMQGRLLELENKNRRLEERIWDLERQNEVLGKQAQDNYRIGYQAGMAESQRPVHAVHDTEVSDIPPQAEPAAFSQAMIDFGASGAAEPELFVEPLTQVPPDTGFDYNLADSGGAVLFPAGEGTAVLDREISDRSSGFGESGSSVEPVESKDTVLNEDIPVTVPQAPISAEQPEHECQPGKRDFRSADEIYNVARTIPCPELSNPLMELSWRDLETVYNFRIASLREYARHIPGPPLPAAQTDSLPAGHMESRTGDPNQTADNLPSLQPTLTAVPSARRNRPADNQNQKEYSGEFPATSSADVERRDDRSETAGSQDLEPTVDLDALDIFEDINEYVDINQIGAIKDARSFGAESRTEPVDDALMELIKGRIKEASQLPSDPVTPLSTPPPPVPGTAESARPVSARSKFVGGAKAPQEPPPAGGFVVRQIPPDIRKACLILGVRPEELTSQMVLDAWKKQIATPGVHPDLGGDTEAAVYLNIAKDTLVRWLDAQAPKLGKKFGKPQ